MDPWRRHAAPDVKSEAVPEDARPALRIGQPTHCRRCGRRLWADDEKLQGICVPCHWRARAALAASRSSRAVLTSAHDRSHGREPGWDVHTGLGRMVIVILWAFTILASAGAMTVVMAVARTGVRGLQVNTITAIALLGSLAAANGLAAGSYTRFKLWAWWYTVALFGLAAAAGGLAYLTGGSTGPLILGIVSLLTLIASVSTRLRRSAKV